MPSKKLSFLGQIFLKFSVFIARIYPSDYQNLYIHRKHVIFVSYILESILFQIITISWNFPRHFLDFWSKKNYMIWWNFVVRHCIFSRLEEKLFTFYPNMETHPNFLSVGIVIPYNMFFPMNQHLGYLPTLLSELAQIENSLMWWRNIVKWK